MKAGGRPWWGPIRSPMLQCLVCRCTMLLSSLGPGLVGSRRALCSRPKSRFPWLLEFWSSLGPSLWSVPRRETSTSFAVVRPILRSDSRARFLRLFRMLEADFWTCLLAPFWILASSWPSTLGIAIHYHRLMTLNRLLSVWKRRSFRSCIGCGGSSTGRRTTRVCWNVWTESTLSSWKETGSLLDDWRCSGCELLLLLGKDVDECWSCIVIIVIVTPSL